MRKKEITLDGASVTIAALSFTQTKEFAAKYQAAKKEEGFDLDKLAEANLSIVLGSINRANKNLNMTKEKLVADWDRTFYTFVFQQIMAFSEIEIGDSGDKQASS